MINHDCIRGADGKLRVDPKNKAQFEAEAIGRQEVTEEWYWSEGVELNVTLWKWIEGEIELGLDPWRIIEGDQIRPGMRLFVQNNQIPEGYVDLYIYCEGKGKAGSLSQASHYDLQAEADFLMREAEESVKNG